MSTPKTHGWVHPIITPAPKARCGGPSICEQCRKERDASLPVIDPNLLPPARPAVIAAKRMGFEPFDYAERN